MFIIEIVHRYKLHKYNYFFNDNILYSDFQASEVNLTISPFFFHKIAFQKFDSFDILGISAKISASVEPTILYVSFSFDSIFSTQTIAPTVTLSLDNLSSEIISTFFKSDSKSKILFSTAACSFLASSYSEFSDKSQNEIASFNFSAISTLFTSFKFFNSSCNLSNHSAVTKILSAIFIFLYIKFYL